MVRKKIIFFPVKHSSMSHNFGLRMFWASKTAKTASQPETRELNLPKEPSLMRLRPLVSIMEIPFILSEGTNFF